MGIYAAKKDLFFRRRYESALREAAYGDRQGRFGYGAEVPGREYLKDDFRTPKRDHVILGCVKVPR